MRLRCPFAQWRPLGQQTEPLIGHPRVLIFHTMVGSLWGTDSYFRDSGYHGVESHFGVGEDGTILQWQELNREADANWDANNYATSIETADGGDPSRPWTDAQLRALVDLTVWWCRETGNPARLVDDVSGHGIGYHRQFWAWNQSNHACPGDTRQRQLIHEVIPRAAEALGGHWEPPKNGGGGGGGPTYHCENGDGLLVLHERDCGGGAIAYTQRALNNNGASLDVDGFYGPDTEQAVRGFQRDEGIAVDGIVGQVTRQHLFGLRDSAPDFPLPDGHWFGPESPNPRNHSGYWERDRDDIRRLQAELRQRGWVNSAGEPLHADGFYGPETTRVVRLFQRDSTAHGWPLADDGLVGALTWPVIWERPVT